MKPGLVHAGGDHELVDAAEALERGVEHRIGVLERVRSTHDGFDLAADLAHFGRDLVELALACPTQARACRRARQARVAQPRPKAPDAPVTIATLPLLSNSDSGWRSCSEIMVCFHHS